MNSTRKDRRFMFGPGTAIAAAAVILLLAGTGTLQSCDASSDTDGTEEAEQTVYDTQPQERTIEGTAFTAAEDPEEAAADEG